MTATKETKELKKPKFKIMPPLVTYRQVNAARGTVNITSSETLTTLHWSVRRVEDNWQVRWIPIEVSAVDFRVFTAAERSVQALFQR